MGVLARYIMTIVTTADVNRELKAARKSFEVAVSYFVAMSAHVKSIKEFLKQRGYSISYLKSKDEKGHLVCKELMQYLPLADFKTADGKTTYKAIYRKDKEGNVVQANWTIALVMKAMDNRIKEMTGKKNIAKAVEMYQADKTIAKAFDIAKKQAVKNAKTEEVKDEPIKAEKQKTKPATTKAKTAKVDFSGVPEADAQKVSAKKSNVSKAAAVKARTRKNSTKKAS